MKRKHEQNILSLQSSSFFFKLKPQEAFSFDSSYITPAKDFIDTRELRCLLWVLKRSLSIVNNQITVYLKNNEIVDVRGRKSKLFWPKLAKRILKLPNNFMIDQLTIGQSRSRETIGMKMNLFLQTICEYDKFSSEQIDELIDSILAEPLTIFWDKQNYKEKLMMDIFDYDDFAYLKKYLSITNYANQQTSDVFINCPQKIIMCFRHRKLACFAVFPDTIVPRKHFDYFFDLRNFEQKIIESILYGLSQLPQRFDEYMTKIKPFGFSLEEIYSHTVYNENYGFKLCFYGDTDSNSCSKHFNVTTIPLPPLINSIRPKFSNDITMIILLRIYQQMFFSWQIFDTYLHLDDEFNRYIFGQSSFVNLSKWNCDENFVFLVAYWTMYPNCDIRSTRVYQRWLNDPIDLVQKMLKIFKDFLFTTYNHVEQFVVSSMSSHLITNDEFIVFHNDWKDSDNEKQQNMIVDAIVAASRYRNFSLFTNWKPLPIIFVSGDLDISNIDPGIGTGIDQEILTQYANVLEKQSFFFKKPEDPDLWYTLGSILNCALINAYCFQCSNTFLSFFKFLLYGWNSKFDICDLAHEDEVMAQNLIKLLFYDNIVDLDLEFNNNCQVNNENVFDFIQFKIDNHIRKSYRQLDIMALNDGFTRTLPSSMCSEFKLYRFFTENIVVLENVFKSTNLTQILNSDGNMIHNEKCFQNGTCLTNVVNCPYAHLKKSLSLFNGKQLGLFLKFVTGSDRMEMFTVTQMINERKFYPEAQTCTGVLYLYNEIDFDRFHDSLLFVIENIKSFGYI